MTKQYKDGTWSFIIPRFFEGGTVVGGTKQPGDFNAEPDFAIRESLLREGGKIAALATDSKGSGRSVNVLADIVGRRPVREGGMRIEVEQPGATTARKRSPVVHAYGAGGRGFEISWGVAEEVAQLVEHVLSTEEPILARL